MMLKFYMTPGSCSTGIHILLEEVEVPFEVTILNLPAGDHRQPCYLVINPKGTIPALMLADGHVLTEFQAIAYWLARTYPRKGLLPEDPVKAATAMELMDYVVGTIHGQGYTRIFTTDTYLPAGLADEEAQRWRSAIEARGQEIVDQGFKVIEARLSDEGYAVGPRLSIADTALFYVFFWADRIGLPLPERCADGRRLSLNDVPRNLRIHRGTRSCPGPFMCTCYLMTCQICPVCRLPSSS